MSRRTTELLLAFTLGAWLAETIGLWIAAGQNFGLVDRLLEDGAAEFHRRVALLEPETARQVLRYFASEVNRLYFQIWNVVQMALGATAVLLVYRANLGRAPLILAGTALAIVALLTAVVMPTIIRIGRSLDFLVRQPPPAELATFGAWHGTYVLLDFVKALALGALFVLLLRSRPLPA